MKKLCVCCKKIKPYDKFRKSSKMLLGIRSSCKACELIKQKLNRDKNLEKYRAINNKSSKKCIEKRREYKLKWQRDNRYLKKLKKKDEFEYHTELKKSITKR